MSLLNAVLYEDIYSQEAPLSLMNLEKLFLNPQSVSTYSAIERSFLTQENRDVIQHIVQEISHIQPKAILQFQK